MEFFSEIINFSIIIDILDLILVAGLLYYAYKLLKGTVAINIFIGIILIYILWRGTLVLDMEFLSSIIGGFMSVGIIALIVVFQPEIRKFLLMVGSANISKKGSVFDKINGIGKKTKLILLSYFGSLDNIKSAGIEDLRKVPSIGLKTAEKIYKEFNKNV